MSDTTAGTGQASGAVSIPSAVVEGVDGYPVRIEVLVSDGIPGYTLIGMPDKVCRESRDRIRAAIVNGGFAWPHKRVTVNVTPARFRTAENSSLDLPVALLILAASGQIAPEALEGMGAVGELGLDGSVQPVRGLVCLAGAVEARRVMVPADQTGEAHLVHPVKVRPARSLPHAVAVLNGARHLRDEPWEYSSWADRQDQLTALWALEVAAAGGHNLLIVGPPGLGRTILAHHLTVLLPDLDPEASMQITRVHSAAGLRIPPGGIGRPPMRSPQFTSSLESLIGGGTTTMRPGEISCAHGGVLFLDDLQEFPTAAIDALRQPLDQGVIKLSRASRSVTLPAQFQLVAAMNPCPCGGGGGGCQCSDHARARYTRRLSGPLLEHLDLRVRAESNDALLDVPDEVLTDIAARVQRVRALARRRGVVANAQLDLDQLDDAALVTDKARATLRVALQSGQLTPRGLTGVRRVALTMADLLGAKVNDKLVSAALTMRGGPDTARRESPARHRTEAQLDPPQL